MSGIVIPDEMVPDCVQCRLYFEDKGFALLHTCATVGIEHGRSARDECALYMNRLHKEHEAQRS